jgi:predicted Kef-type K+ transport protein
VIQLMFGVGLHFSIRDLLMARTLAIPGALLQMASATCLGAALAFCWGWSPGGALVFGLALSVASTVVLLRALQTQGTLSSEAGRIAVGWLIVEDLTMVLVLVLLPAFAGALGGQAPGHGSAPQSAHMGSVLTIAGVTLTKVAAFSAVMLLAGRPILRRVLKRVEQVGSDELLLFSIAINPLIFRFVSTLERPRVPAAEGRMEGAMLQPFITPALQHSARPEIEDEQEHELETLNAERRTRNA